MAGESILIVDDNPENSKLLAFILERKGYSIRVASGAQAAIDAVRTAKPKLILMDLQMPDIDGYELTRRFKADPATRDVVIVAVTAFAMKGDEQKAIAAGCDGYVTKPIDTRALPGLVAAHLSKPAL